MTVKSRVLAVSLSFSVLILSGCSTVGQLPGMRMLFGEDEGYLRDRQSEYLEANSIARTDIPGELDSYVIDDLYVIPEAAGSDNHFPVPPRPRALEGSSDRRVVIQTIDDRSWIVVGLSPSQVWPRVTDYWARKSVPIAVENPSAGVMETGWFRLAQREQERQKFRIMIEPGFQDNSAEIRLLNLGVSNDVTSPDAVSFPETSTDPELETEFLRDLSGFLADFSGAYQASTVSFMAGNISSEGKASLRTDESGEEILHLQADYLRSWGAIGLALERAEVEIEAREQELGVYEVVYTPEDEERGFFGRLFRGDNGPYRMEVRLIREGDAVHLKVNNLGPEPGRNEPDPEEALLRLLRNNIA